MSLTFAPKLAVARVTGALSRRSGRGGGTTLPGRVLLRLAPDAITRLSSGLPGGTTVVSATNGKTTTAGMIASALRAAGRVPVHNRAGSNMSWGVATALLEQRGEEGLFEVDEAWLPRIVSELNGLAGVAIQADQPGALQPAVGHPLLQAQVLQGRLPDLLAVHRARRGHYAPLPAPTARTMG